MLKGPVGRGLINLFDIHTLLKNPGITSDNLWAHQISLETSVRVNNNTGAEVFILQTQRSASGSSPARKSSSLLYPSLLFRPCYKFEQSIGSSLANQASELSQLVALELLGLLKGF